MFNQFLIQFFLKNNKKKIQELMIKEVVAKNKNIIIDLFAK